mgnify:CR=1 FL=1
MGLEGSDGMESKGWDVKGREGGDWKGGMKWEGRNGVRWEGRVIRYLNYKLQTSCFQRVTIDTFTFIRKL